MRKTPARTFLVILLPLLLAPTLATADQVTQVFAVMGCNRISHGDVDPQSNPSSANLAQLERTFADLVNLEHLDPDQDIGGAVAIPTHFFFTGDLVYGHTDHDAVLDAELAAWVPLWERSAPNEQGVKLVPIPGNHEFLVSKDGGEQVPAIYGNPNSDVEGVWLKNVAAYVRGDNGPGPSDPGNPDNLRTDQSRLTYSFDATGNHFVLLNTDYACQDDGGDQQCGVARAPLHWLKADLAAATKDPKTERIFVLGHKPAYPIPGYASYPQDSMGLHPDERTRFWDTLNDADAVAYLTAHSHAWHRDQPVSADKPHIAKTWQIIAGNAGSTLDSQWTQDPDHVKDNFFGFTVIKIYESGRVRAVSYGRGYGPDYDSPSDPATYTTAARAAFDLVGGQQ